jgi:hypothetical protein
MNSRSTRILWIFIFALLLGASSAHSMVFGLNLYGLSYHPDRKDSEGNKLNGLNPGVGIQWIIRETRRGILDMNNGFYKDSRNNAAEYVSVGYKFKVIESLSFGPALFVYHSSEYNGGRPILAPLPVISFRYKQISWNALYAPRFKATNRNSVFAFYATVYFRGKEKP